MQLLEQRINQSFRLFTGLRSEEADYELHTAICERCLVEAARFLEEELDATALQEIEQMLSATLLVEGDSAHFPIILKEIGSHIQKYPDLGFRLEHRLLGFVDGLTASVVLQPTP